VFYFVVMLFVLGTFGLRMKNGKWATLGYFSRVVGAITSERSGNPGNCSCFKTIFFAERPTRETRCHYVRAELAEIGTL